MYTPSTMGGDLSAAAPKDDESNARRKTHRGGERRRECYKTRMCRRLMETGDCPLGEACTFAHHIVEKRGNPCAPPDDERCCQSKATLPAWKQERLKSKLCRHMAQSGSCPFGSACAFAHGEVELRRGSPGPCPPPGPPLHLEEQRRGPAVTAAPLPATTTLFTPFPCYWGVKDSSITVSHHVPPSTITPYPMWPPAAQGMVLCFDPSPYRQHLPPPPSAHPGYTAE